MKNANPTINIRPITEKPGFYIAYFSSEVLQATVSLHFKDTIVGAIALNNFVEMLFSGSFPRPGRPWPRAVPHCQPWNTRTYSRG